MQKLSSKQNDLTLEEVAHREQAFREWLRTKGAAMGYYLLPTVYQERVREMLRRSFYAGSNYEARMTLQSMQAEQSCGQESA